MSDKATGLPPVCDYEHSDYQETFWGKGDRKYEDQVEAVALRRLLPAEGKILLELGAGAGRNTPRYQGFERIVLLDYSLTQLQQARQRLNQHDHYIYVAANIYCLPFIPRIFDAATMIRVLHHLSNPVQALHQIHEVLQDDAIFILEYANKHHIKAILRYLFRRQTWSPFDLEPVEFAELNFDFHPRMVRKWLHECNFKLERQLSVSHYRYDPLKKFIPLKILVAMDSVAQLTGDWWQLTPSIFTRSRVIYHDQIQNIPNREPSWNQAMPELLFCCPNCHHDPLEYHTTGLVCPNCRKLWPIIDGIYDFRETVSVFSTTQK